MADRKISDLTALTTPASGDYLPIVDISEASAANKNKRITIEELLRGAPDGTAGAPGFAFESDPDSGLYSTGANGVALSTGGTGRLFIDASGNVGVGTSSPGYTLDVAGSARIKTGATGTPFVVSTGGDSQGSLRFGSSGFLYGIYGGPDYLSLQFHADGAERARIDNSGRLLVGTSTARTNFFNTAWGTRFQVEGTSDETSSIGAICNLNDIYGPSIQFAKSRGTTVGSNTVVQNGDTVGSIGFQGSDGSEFVAAASISAVVDGTPGANDMPGRLVFSTTADGASSPTERMRIANNGNMMLGGTTQRNSARFSIDANGTDAPFSLYVPSTASYTNVFFENPNGVVGSIVTSGSATAYNTSSDYRLKENVTAVTDGITRLQQLKPSRFNFIADPTKTVDGFMAHEVQTIVPEAITGEKDAVDDDGNPIYQGIDQSKLVPLLTAALQEAIGEINALKDRLTAAGI